MLRDIKAGKPIEACTRAPAIGSYLHKKAGLRPLLRRGFLKETNSKSDKKRSRRGADAKG